MGENDHAVPRPINALSAMSLVLIFPGRTFQRLRERPHWILPLVFVMAASMTSAVYAVRGGYMDGFISNVALRTAASPAQIESGFLAAGVIMAIAVVPIVALMEAFFFRVIGTAFGGRAPFRTVFSAVVHASVPAGVGALVFAVLMPLTRSPTAGANLSFLVDPLKSPFWWSFARQIDLFSIWYFVLLGIAAEPLFRLPRRRARVAALTFALLYLAIMSWSGVGGAARFADPYRDWSIEGAGETVVRLSPDADPSRVDDVLEAVQRGRERVAEIAAIGGDERITCYLYASLDEKERLTGNVTLAHGVEWARVVHVVWGNEADVAIVRETAKVIAADSVGTVYNPSMLDGLGILAGWTWDGDPVVEVAGGLRERGELPPLEDLLDPARYSVERTAVAQPSAGAFAAFLVSALGADGYRDVLTRIGRDARPAVDVIEDALGMELEAVESKWSGFLSKTPAGDGEASYGGAR